MKIIEYDIKQDVYHELTTGVEFYLVQDNTINKNLNNDED
jgi:hypothetical protein